MNYKSSFFKKKRIEKFIYFNFFSETNSMLVKNSKSTFKNNFWYLSQYQFVQCLYYLKKEEQLFLISH